MTPADYAIGLASIVIALAITDMLSNLRRLLRNTTSIRWDALFLLAVICIVMRIVSFWLTLWMSREFLGATSLGVRLLGLLNLVPVYLLAGSIFPENPTGRADLREYYHDNARFTWSLFSFNLGYFATYGIFVQVAGGASWQVMLQFLAWFWIPVPFTIALAVWPRWRLLHWIVLVPLTLWAVVPIVATRL